MSVNHDKFDVYLSLFSFLFLCYFCSVFLFSQFRTTWWSTVFRFQVGSCVFIHGLVTWSGICINRCTRELGVMLLSVNYGCCMLLLLFHFSSLFPFFTSTCLLHPRWVAEVSEEGQGLNLKIGRVVAPEADGRLGVLVQPGWTSQNSCTQNLEF